MVFLAELKRNNTDLRRSTTTLNSPFLFKLQSSGLERALQLNTNKNNEGSRLENRERRRFTAPFSKPAVEMLRELERKAVKEDIVREDNNEPERGNESSSSDKKAETPFSADNQDGNTSNKNHDVIRLAIWEQRRDTTPFSKSSETLRELVRNAEQKIITKDGNNEPERRNEFASYKKDATPSLMNNQEDNTSNVPPRSSMLEEMMHKPETFQPPAPPIKNAMLAEILRKRQSVTSIQDDYASDSNNALSPSENVAPETCDDVPLKDHRDFAKYFIMLKRGLPKPAVQHKMTQDNVDPSILDMDPNAPFQILSLGDDPIYATYFRMLKNGLPKSTVVHKLQADGISSHLVDLDAHMRTVPKCQIDAAFRAHQAKIVERYQVMYKRGMPEEAVRHKMTIDGVDPGWLYLGKIPPQSGSSTTPAIQPIKLKPDIVRKKLHWSVISKDTIKGKDTLWQFSTEVALSSASMEALESLFVRSIKEETKVQNEKHAGSAVKPKLIYDNPRICLFDMKKAQNMGITLARIKVPFESIKHEILNMNTTIMSSMHLKALIDLWPDEKEMKAIRNYNGDPQLLGNAERFCYEMRDTIRFTDKLQCLIFKQEFPSRSHELRETIVLVQRCVNQICASADLRDMLLLVLKVGNLLNFGNDATSPVHYASGFSLSSLVKLSQTKAFVGQTTLLQFLVETVDRDAPHLAKFEDDVGLLERSSRILIEQLHLEKKALETGHARLISEAEKIEDEENCNADGCHVQTNLTAVAIRFFATKAALEMKDLDEQLEKLAVKKKQFLDYFGEVGEYGLDELLSALWAFTEEFRFANRKYLLKKARTVGKPSNFKL